jgi:hypothetical protein
MSWQTDICQQKRLWKARRTAMTTLLIENFKLIVLGLLIGTIIGLSQIGAKTTARAEDMLCPWSP